MAQIEKLSKTLIRDKNIHVYIDCIMFYTIKRCDGLESRSTR
jgi:hypothetical protein